MYVSTSQRESGAGEGSETAIIEPLIVAGCCPASHAFSVLRWGAASPRRAGLPALTALIGCRSARRQKKKEAPDVPLLQSVVVSEDA